MIFNFIKKYGLRETWEALIYNNSKIKDFASNERIKEDLLKGLDYYQITDLFEDTLAYANKLSKKENGQYYTPDDVCDFLAKQTINFDEGVWCDPCCGTGNISYKLVERNPKFLDNIKNEIFNIVFQNVIDLVHSKQSNKEIIYKMKDSDLFDDITIFMSQLIH